MALLFGAIFKIGPQYKFRLAQERPNLNQIAFAPIYWFLRIQLIIIHSNFEIISH